MPESSSNPGRTQAVRDARIGPQPSTWAIRTDAECPSWGSAFKARLKEFPRTMQVATHSTSLALATNNVTLDPDLKDAWGLPAIRVTYRDHPDALATQRFLQDRGGIEDEEMFRAFNMGIGLVIVCAAEHASRALDALATAGEQPVRLGAIVAGAPSVQYRRAV